MNARSKTTLVVLWTLLGPCSAAAAADDDRWLLEVEVDPVSISLGGYAAFVGLGFPQIRNFVLACGSYGFEQPNALMLPEQRDVGWRVSSKNVVIGPEYFFSEDRRGWSVALFFLHSWLTVEHPTGIVANRTSWVLMPAGAYSWFPFEDLGLYLGLWLGVVFMVDGYGDVEIAGDTYEELRIGPTAAGRIGWRF
jgi:hypothetical protein